MKKIQTLTLCALSLLFMKSSLAQTVADIDGNVYPIVTIGTQDWLSENLRTTKLTDGTPIPLLTDNTAWINTTAAAYCWYGNDQVLNGTTYGGLYNFHTVQTGKLCPSGWHVPTNTEWQTLVDYLGGVTLAGNKLKEAGTAHWSIPNSAATNESGFTALPGGQRGAYGVFDLLHGAATFWTSTETSPVYANTWALFYHSGACQNVGDVKEGGKSVRCIKGSVNSLNDADQSGLNLRVYPNPAPGVFYVQQQTGLEATLQVLDVFGNIVLMKKFSNQTSVSIPNPGIYLVRVSTRQGVQSQTVLIQ